MNQCLQINNMNNPTFNSDTVLFHDSEKYDFKFNDFVYEKDFLNTQVIDKANYDFNFGYIYVNDEDNTQTTWRCNCYRFKKSAFFNSVQVGNYIYLDVKKMIKNQLYYKNGGNGDLHRGSDGTLDELQ